MTTFVLVFSLKVQSTLTKFCRRFSCFLFTAFLLIPANALSEEHALTGVWNGFNNHINVVECNTAANIEEKLELAVRDNAGATIGTHSFTLPAHGTHHAILNKFPIDDRYGTYVIKINRKWRKT